VLLVCTLTALALCSTPATATVTPTMTNPAADVTYLIPSETGPVHYPACAGPLTWSINSEEIAGSGSTVRREQAMWTAIFTEVQSQTDYVFQQVDPGTPAHIPIHYAADPIDRGLTTQGLSATTAGLGGITDLGWNGSHWVAHTSIVIMNPTSLRRWAAVRGLREWVARHELGHALGLGHSADQTRIMAPRYNMLFARTTYHPTDIAALQALARHSCT